MGEIRSVSVRLDADVTAYIAKMKLAGAETDRAFSSRGRSIDTTNTKLTTTERELGKVDASARKVDSSMGSLNRRMDDGGRSIDRYSGRLGVLLDLSLALAPALAPIGAELVPATFALGSNVASLGIGAGVTMLAFHGLGDALTKFNKAALDPTATNIKNAQLAMDKLPPPARQFVLELHRLGPEVQGLQRIAANGILPGARAGLRDLETDLPIVRRGVRLTSRELGTLARDTGDALSSRRWRPFLRFLGVETPAALDTLGRAGGHTLHGLATLLMGFGPTTREIDQGILNLARDFDHWATVTERSKGFEDFLDYLRENGPRVLDLLGQTGKTFIDIGTAVAPLGGPTLDILTKLLEVVDDIANSDFGTPLFAGMVAFRLYARVAQLAGVQVETSFKGMAAAPDLVRTKVGSLATSTRAATSSMIGDFRAMSTEFQRTTRTIADPGVAGGSLFSKNPLGMVSTLRATEKTTKGVGRFRSTVISALSGTSEAAQRTRARLGELAKGGALAAGVAVVASGAADKVGLANTASLAMVGTLAGPYGAAVGGAVGLTMDLAHANDSLVDSIHSVDAAMDGSGVAVNFAAQGQALADLNQQIASYEASMRRVGNPQGLLRTVSDLFTHTDSEARARADSFREFNTLSFIAFRQISQRLGGAGGNDPSDAQLQQTAERAQPAMLALGITVNDLTDAAKRNDGSLAHMTRQIVAWTNRADSASGRTVAVASAFAHMSDQTLTLDDRVQALTSSLDALLGPKLGLEASRGQLQQGLNDLGKTLNKSSLNAKNAAGRLTDAAIENRSALQQQVTNIESLITAQARAGVPADKMTASLKANRQALIDAGVAAGLSRQEITAYINQLGLTPKFVQTSISLVGTEQAAGQLGGLRRELEGLKDRTIHVHVRTDHIGTSDTTATGGHVLTGPTAMGGTIPGPRYPYGDKMLTPTAPGEEVISNQFGQADKNRAALKAANRGARLAVIDGPGMAGGGTVERFHQVSTNLVTTRSSSRVTERIVERLPRSMRLAVDGDDLYALIDSGAQDNYEANRTYEEAHG